MINVDDTIKLTIAARFNLTQVDATTGNVNEAATVRVINGILTNLINNNKLAAQGNLYQFL